MSHEPDWYAELADALKSRKLDATRIGEIVAEARAHCAASGEQPADAFGDAHAYAAHVTSTEDPDETRFQNMAERYADVRQPVGFRLLAWLGAMLASLAASGWLISGTSSTVTAPELFSWFVVFVAIVCVLLRDDARRAGYPTTARRYLIAWVVLLGVSIAASFFVPQTALFRVTYPPLVVAGIGLAAAGFLLGSRWTKAHPPATRLPADVWLDRLAGLLEGRYRLTAARAREFRTEAAAHLAESGGDPEQEFGPVDDYAAELAERSGLDKRGSRSRSAWVLLTLTTLFFGSTAVYAVAQEGFLNVRSGILIVIALLSAKALVGKAVELYRTSSARRSTWAGSSDQQ